MAEALVILAFPALALLGIWFAWWLDRRPDPDWTADLVPDARPWRRITTDEG